MVHLATQMTAMQMFEKQDQALSMRSIADGEWIASGLLEAYKRTVAYMLPLVTTSTYANNEKALGG